MVSFQDEDLDEIDTDFEGAVSTPHRIHGRGAMVYWQDCKVTLMKPVNGQLVFVRHISRRKGKGRLDAGETLVFMDDGGKVKEG